MIGVIFDALRVGGRDLPDLRRRLDRQPYRHPSPLAFLALDRDRAGVKLDDHLDEVESDSGPHDSGNIAAAMITLEYSVQVFCGNTDSVILDGDDDLFRINSCADLNGMAAR